ncbi:MAG: hypothetical protein ACI4RI_06795, partial [Ruminococcus sp.]
NGVACVIDRIERMRIPHSKVRRNYYVMHDICKEDNVYYIPTDSEGNMRYPITREEATNLLDSIDDIEQIKIGMERFRDEEYRKGIKESSPQMLVAMLKYFQKRKKERISAGKTLSSIDEKYMKLASRNLFSELSCSLSISVEEVESIINRKIS